MPKNRNRNSKQKGGKMVLPANYFNPNSQETYTEGNTQCGSSYGTNFNENMTGGLVPTINNNQSGGGPLPAAYFGGSNDGYYEAGAPELNNCTTPYGINHPISHGVVLDGPAGGMWMGPNLGPGPNAVEMTGGARRRKRRNSKRRTLKRKGNLRRRTLKRRTLKRRGNLRRKTTKRKNNLKRRKNMRNKRR